jgi:UDP-N-acetyl-D-mannosaminuronic acid dehydrogenase
MKVCVCGIGEVGYPTAEYIQDKGLEVWGYDTDPFVIKVAKEKGALRATSNWCEIPSVDVYIICVSSSKGNVGDRSSVFDVCKKISQKASSQSLVSIESTILPGTSRTVYEEIFKRKINMVHVPHRYWAEDTVRHGVKQLRVFGAVNSKSLNVGLKFYRDVLEVPLHVVTSIETAEMCKISENAYRYVQIAFAEELKMMCKEIGLSFNDVRNACNTKWNTEILEARDGIGGRCLPKDTRLLQSLTGHNIILESAVVVDKKYRKWLSNRCQKHVAGSNPYDGAR